MVLPEPYFSLSDSRDTSCAIRFLSEPVPQLRDSWDNTWCYRKPRRYRFPPCKASNLIITELLYESQLDVKLVKITKLGMPELRPHMTRVIPVHTLLQYIMELSLTFATWNIWGLTDEFQQMHAGKDCERYGLDIIVRCSRKPKPGNQINFWYLTNMNFIFSNKLRSVIKASVSLLVQYLPLISYQCCLWISVYRQCPAHQRWYYSFSCCQCLQAHHT